MNPPNSLDLSDGKNFGSKRLYFYNNNNNLVSVLVSPGISRMGLNKMLTEVMSEDAQVTENGAKNQATAGGSSEGSAGDSDEDYDKKSDTAIDYSDIVELAEDIQSSMPVNNRIWICN